MSVEVRQIAPAEGGTGDRLGRDDPALAGSTGAAAEFARSTATIPTTALPLSNVIAALRGGEGVALAAPPLLPRLRPPNGYVTLEGEPSLRLPAAESDGAPFERAALIAPQAFSRPVIEVPSAAEAALERALAARDRLPDRRDIVPTADLIERDGRAVGQPGLRVSGSDYMMFLSIAGDGTDALVTANVLSRSTGGAAFIFDGSAITRTKVKVELAPRVRDALATLLEAVAMPGDASTPTLSDHAALLALGGIRG